MRPKSQSQINTVRAPLLPAVCIFFTHFLKFSRAVSNQEVVMMARVRYLILYPSPEKQKTHFAIMRLLRYFHFFLLHRKAYLLIFAKKAVCSATKWSTYFFIFRANRNLQMCIKINIDKDRSLDKCDFIKCMYFMSTYFLCL